MTDSSSRYQAVLAEVDAANASDPRQDIVGGQIVGGESRPREVVYSQRMTECLELLYPDASEELRIAARAQHICRWQITRANYPLGRDGYNSWRAACREHHAALSTAIMRRHGYAEKQVAHVAKLIKKEDLKRNRESQALENVVAVVFAKHYLSEFIAGHADYTEEKLIGILAKTLRKMDAVGHAAVSELPLPPHVQRVVEIALKVLEH